MPRSPRRALWIAIPTTALGTLAIVLVVHNFTGGEKPDPRVTHRYPERDSAFIRAMGIALQPSIVRGNRVTALLNGDEIFPAMLADIRAAQKSITMETYIYWGGQTGEAFANALAERARAGVKVHVLVDWVGSDKMDKKSIETMENAGIAFRMYRPLRWYNLGRVNKRTHRKLLSVDGRIGYTGGVGIADIWNGNAQDSLHWRDTHFRVEGPAVAQIQSAFLDNWIEATGEVLHGDDYFPPLAPVGPHPAQLFYSSSAGGSESMELMYLIAIAAAEHSIRVSSAYFLPDEATQQALLAAIGRGVKVDIIVPGKHMDTKIVRGASRSQWGRLLEAGAGIHEYEPTMYHTKVVIVDELLVSVGSTNWDPRSFQLNDEANLNIYDEEFARAQVATFEQDLAKSHKVTLDEWKHRPLREKFGDWFKSLLRGAL